MKVPKFPVLMIPVVAVALLVGCSGGDAPASRDDCDPPLPDARAAAADAADTAAADAAESVDALIPGEGEMVLAGTIGCGHCTFHKGDSCAAAMVSAEVVYFLDGIEAGHELFDDRMSEKPLTVVGKVFEKDGDLRVTVRDYQM